MKFILKNTIDLYTKSIKELYVKFLDVAVYISEILLLILVFFQPKIIVDLISYILIGLILLIKFVESNSRIKKILKKIALILNLFIIFLFLNLYFNFSNYLKIRFENVQKIIESGLGQFELIIISIIILMTIAILYMISFASLVYFILIKIKKNKLKKFLVIIAVIFMLIMGEMIFNPLESYDISRLRFLGGFSLLFLHINYFFREMFNFKKI